MVTKYQTVIVVELLTVCLKHHGLQDGLGQNPWTLGTGCSIQKAVLRSSGCQAVIRSLLLVPSVKCNGCMLC